MLHSRELQRARQGSLEARDRKSRKIKAEAKRIQIDDERSFLNLKPNRIGLDSMTISLMRQAKDSTERHFNAGTWDAKAGFIYTLSQTGLHSETLSTPNAHPTLKDTEEKH